MISFSPLILTLFLQWNSTCFSGRMHPDSLGQSLQRESSDYLSVSHDSHDDADWLMNISAIFNLE